LAGSLEVAKYFRVYLPKFEDPTSEISNKISNIAGLFEKKHLADLSGFFWS